MSKRDFTIIKKIGSGSFSNVFKVRRLEDDNMYAMKEINFNSLKSDDKDGCLNEVRLLASIKSD
jgi:NIMA (never in mitosis gene a)-related kinase